MSDWKPGDVAVVSSAISGPTVRIYGEYPSGHNARWYEGHGGFVRAEDVTEVHPLVVIDPEDAEQVKRLDDLLTRFIEGDEVPDYEGTEGVTRAALREFARPTPPKPAEPTGLGAVVEYQGGRYVRAREQTTVRHWHPADGLGNAFRWDDFNNGAVTVLSEGIPS